MCFDDLAAPRLKSNAIPASAHGTMDVGLDTAVAARAWHAARDAIRGVLLAKPAAPVERRKVDATARSAGHAFEKMAHAYRSAKPELANGECGNPFRLFRLRP
jgi:hypothetical protein